MPAYRPTTKPAPPGCHNGADPHRCHAPTPYTRPEGSPSPTEDFP